MQDYSNNIILKSSKKRGLNWGLWISLIFIAVLFLILFYPKNQTPKSEIDNGKKNDQSKETAIHSPSVPFTAKSEDELLEKIEEISESGPGTYSVYIFNLKSKKGFGLNEKIVITAASVNKAVILAVLYHLASKNEIDLEKIVVLQKEDIQDYGTGSIRYDPVGTAYSLKTLARLMMEKSDNTAAYILGSLTLSLEKIQGLIETWGLTQTDMAKNKSSLQDMSVLFSKMYLGDITKSPYTQEMLDFMDKSDFDDRIPKYLPDNIKIFHKTGDEIGKVHDAGIVDLPDKPFFLGIFTTDITDEEKTKTNIALISEMVFNFMKSN